MNPGDVIGDHKHSILPTRETMADRDPFPMRSEEAHRLAVSVDENGAHSWHKMGTSVSVQISKKSDNNSEIEESLNSNKLSSTEKNDDQEQHHDEAKYAGDSDDFIDAPRDSEGLLRAQDVANLPRPIGSLLLLLQRCFWNTRQTAKSIHHRFYGDTFPWEEFVRTIVLSSTLFILIGGYWLLRSLKDPVLTALCGVSSIPKAKMLSVFVVLGVVTIYNLLLDESSGFRKEQLFYVIGTFYSVLFFGIAFLLKHPTIGLANQIEDPSRILGWVSYCGIESFGSVMVSLFWSFTNSNFNLKQAKRSYGMLVAIAQIGSILGPTFVNRLGPVLGIPTCYMVGASCMVALQITMWIYVKMYGVVEETPETIQKQNDSSSKAGVLEGIHLFMKYNYVKGIFAISAFFMVIGTIVDFTLKVLARERFSSEFPCLPHDEAGEPMSCWDGESNSPVGMSTDALQAFTSYIGFFGQATNTLSFLLSFFGTSAVIRYLGLRTTLLLFPSILLAVIITVRSFPTLDVVFTAMMIIKANSYALNNPTKEILYQPTSSNVKYKAKSWIDIFGARGSKALGSVVTNAFSHSATELVDKGSLVGMCVACFLIWNANFMGKKFDEYTESEYIVGTSPDHEESEYAMVDGNKSASNNLAMGQTENDDTSCAFYDDDEVGAEEEGQSDSGFSKDEDVIVGKKVSGDKKAEVELV